MKRVLKWLAVAFVALVVLAGLACWWAYRTAMSKYEQQWTVHTIDFPIPYPLSGQEVAALRAERIAAGAPEADYSVASAREPADAAGPARAGLCLHDGERSIERVAGLHESTR